MPKYHVVSCHGGRSGAHTSIRGGFVVDVQQAVRQIHNKSKANSKSTTSCRTNSKSYNKFDNLSHSKSTTQIHSKLHATISKSCSKSHNLLYNKSTNRSNGVRHLRSSCLWRLKKQDRSVKCMTLNMADQIAGRENAAASHFSSSCVSIILFSEKSHARDFISAKNSTNNEHDR